MEERSVIRIEEEGISHFPCPIIGFNSRGLLIYANEAAKISYQQYFDVLSGQKASQLFNHFKQENWESFYAKLQENGPIFISTTTAISPGQQEISLWCSYIPSDIEPFLLIFEISLPKDKMEGENPDIEQRVKKLNELNERLSKEVSIRRKIEENLQAYAEELKSKNEELEQFAYVASHDLQEPLRMVSSFTQLFAKRYEGKLGQDADEFIAYIIEGANRMQDLINDLLVYSRVGRKGEEFTEVYLDQVVHMAIQNLGLLVEETSAFIQYENLPEVYGDPRQLVQLMQNLISNAIKFRKENERPEILIEARELPEYWEVAVSDNGIGIDMRHQERIFQIFQRLHTREKYPGTGIGLAICKKIVERHGGEIWMRSEEGKGSTFFFKLRKPDVQNSPPVQ